ncbi:hypothetical protein MCOO_14900 [Mycobacterium cookii]|uniref:Uncharacterized protein n=1 Tax=Mycobacterium cookii TaxID=1775 RepID=A0A7I7KTQ0_9MYCO|nr:hypothetical protein MCOO_14900 [Mycobacterium cookii]
MLVAACLPTAVSVADSYQILPEPGSVEQITGFFGSPVTPPAVVNSFQGQQVFELFDKTTGQVVGTFDADESTNSSLYGAANQLLLVTNDLTGTAGTGSGDVPPVGSIINIADFGHGYQTIYAALASTDGDVVTKYLTTPFGTSSSPGYFDAALGHGILSADTQPVQLADGYYWAPATGIDENITSVGGLPPADIAIEGNQLFNVYDAANDHATGAFQALVTNTSDLVFNTTEEIYVTQDISGTAGTAAGDTPPVGTLMNVFYFADPQIYNLYEVTPTSSGNVISDTLVTPYGDFNIPLPYDATSAMDVHSFTLPTNGESIVPVGTEVLAGVNGVPPVDSSFHGYQEFALEDASGHTIGTFDGDVATTTGLFGNFGNSSEAILVTADSGNVGTAAGELPPVGSEFDVVYHPFGFETIYSDIVSTTGANVISETLVTPWGDFSMPTSMDLAAHLADSVLLVPGGLGELISNLF